MVPIALHKGAKPRAFLHQICQQPGAVFVTSVLFEVPLQVPLRVAHTYRLFPPSIDPLRICYSYML